MLRAACLHAAAQVRTDADHAAALVDYYRALIEGEAPLRARA
jgi:hypothetical protein